MLICRSPFKAKHECVKQWKFKKFVHFEAWWSLKDNIYSLKIEEKGSQWKTAYFLPIIAQFGFKMPIFVFSAY